ncbi:MAG: DNA polymerase, partial [Spirochaetota bacterium]
FAFPPPIPPVCVWIEKTAQKLIAQFGSLDGIYAHLDEIKGKMKDTIAAEKEMAYLSRDLVTIRTDIDLDFSLDQALFAGFDCAKAAEYFTSMEMKSIANDFFGEAALSGASCAAEEEKSIANSPHDYRIIRTEKDLDDALRQIRAKGLVSVDTETTSVKPVDAEIVGVSLSIEEGQGWYIPIQAASLFNDSGVLIDKGAALAKLKVMLEDETIRKIGQNIKYDMIIFRGEGIALRGIIFDDMIASYLLNPVDRRHNLDDMAADHLNYKTVTYEELTGKGKNAVPISEAPLELVCDYACEDTDIALRLYHHFEPLIRGGAFNSLYYDMELPLVDVIADMEQSGIRIDRNYFASLGTEIDAKVKAEETAIYELADEIFNLNSTKELARVLFEKLGLKTVKKTKTGFSTDISVLEELEGTHEIISHLIAYRTLAK